MGALKRRSGGYDAIAAVGELTSHLEGEIERPRLTDAEREAVALFAATAWSGLRWSEVEKHAATLRGLLERLGGGR